MEAVPGQPGEIQTLTDPGKVEILPSRENPADLLSRGCCMKLNSEIWWSGLV
ncbi:hypothetical protein AVEN_65960-1, partial [Araneus ventricosus]